MRVRTATIGLAALAAAFLGTPAGAAPGDEAAIAETFVTARGALQDRDGERVLSTLSEADRLRVETIRAAALSGTQASLSALSPSERFAARGLRHYMSQAEIRRREPAALVEYALDKGWLGPNIIRQAGLGRVSVQGRKATAALLVNGQPVLVPAAFVREDGAWRIDLGQSLEIADVLVRTTAALSKRTEDQVIAETLERLSGRAPVSPR
jgi:hypothetical protein